MKFQYACYISYRGGQHRLLYNFVTEFTEALSNELELQTDLGVFLDTVRLEAGDYFNEKLAQALCRSVCMVSVWTPIFSSQGATSVELGRRNLSHLLVKSSDDFLSR